MEVLELKSLTNGLLNAHPYIYIGGYGETIRSNIGDIEILWIVWLHTIPTRSCFTTLNGEKIGDEDWNFLNEIVQEFDITSLAHYTTQSILYYLLTSGVHIVVGIL